MTSTHSLWQFIRREPVLSISFVCALVSAFFVPPSAAYVDYIDLRVLCLLFCLMAVVAGLQECGLFLVLAQRLLAGERPVRLISLTLILLPFFCSMLVTNDVALITFVPFAILVLEMVGRRDLLIPLFPFRRWPPIWAAWPPRLAARKTCFSTPISPCPWAIFSLCCCP